MCMPGSLSLDQYFICARSVVCGVQRGAPSVNSPPPKARRGSPDRTSDATSPPARQARQEQGKGRKAGAPSKAAPVPTNQAAEQVSLCNPSDNGLNNS